MIKQTIKCKKCGKEFIDFPSNKRRFCSRNCWYKSSERKELSPNYKGGKPNCIECNKKLTNYGGKFCNSCCRKGKKSYLWRDGKGTERHRLKGQREARLWRIAVFMRDNFTCQTCGMRGKYLEADHIKPWSLYPELRYAIDNGRTLCRDCHRKTDTWGYRVFLNKHLN